MVARTATTTTSRFAPHHFRSARGAKLPVRDRVGIHEKCPGTLLTHRLINLSLTAANYRDICIVEEFVKLNAHRIFQIIHSNFCVNLTQHEHENNTNIKKLIKKKCYTLIQFGNKLWKQVLK